MDDVKKFSETYDDEFNTPEKMLYHIELLKERRKELMLENRFLIHTLWYIAVNKKAE